MYVGRHVKKPLFLSDFSGISALSIYFLKLLRYHVSRKSVLWERSCSMQTDEETDMTELIFALRNFANALNLLAPEFYI